MKFEFEISEEMVKEALQHRAREAIIKYADNGWQFGSYIEKRAQELAKVYADKIIEEKMADSKNINERIDAAFESAIYRKVLAKLSKLDIPTDKIKALING